MARAKNKVDKWIITTNTTTINTLTTITTISKIIFMSQVQCQRWRKTTGDYPRGPPGPGGFSQSYHSIHRPRWIYVVFVFVFGLYLYCICIQTYLDLNFMKLFQQQVLSQVQLKKRLEAISRILGFIMRRSSNVWSIWLDLNLCCQWILALIQSLIRFWILGFTNQCSITIAFWSCAHVCSDHDHGSRKDWRLCHHDHCNRYVPWPSGNYSWPSPWHGYMMGIE